MNRQKRMESLRNEMTRRGIDYYLIPTADFHQSEYVGDYFKAREYISGFTGSNGTLLVGKEMAGLWTDGRYFIQAEKELAGTGISLFRMQEAGVPTISEYLAGEMSKGQTLGFDGRCISAAAGLRYEKELKEKKITISANEDLVDQIWSERPRLPCGPVKYLTEDISGESISAKLQKIRAALAQEKADMLLLSKLDEVMWLFNIRGCDVACNPVTLAYAVVTRDEAVLWVQKAACGKEVWEQLQKQGVTISEYQNIFADLQAQVEDQSYQIWADKDQCPYLLYKMLEKHAAITGKKSPVELLKAVKNPVELERMEDIYVKDSLALTRFIKWIKEATGKQRITEWSAGNYARKLRSEIPEFLDDSFKTICAYQENAAMMHYEAKEDDCREIRAEGLLLLDSGGQYTGGTTDVTRTIALGKVPAEIKRHFTAVVCGMLQLSNAVFLEGATGRNLDILARGPVWRMGIDYRCGTGHGIGYMLNVHEGPQNIRWLYNENSKEAILQAGMIVSNEPGVYIEGSHGIRIENIMAVQEKEKNEYGTFLCFKTLTLVPIDREAIEPADMTEEEVCLLNQYHEMVYTKLCPFLSPDEEVWLKAATAPVKK